MSDASAPLEEDTDDEIPLLEHHCDDSHPPTPSLSTHAHSSSMECLSSLTDPIRAYFFPGTSSKPRSKSLSHAERPSPRAPENSQESFELPETPPLRARTNEETKKGSLRAVREKQQAAYYLALQAKRESQRRHQPPQSGLSLSLASRDREHGQMPRRKKRQVNDAEMEKLLAPVQAELNRLRTTTIPPCNSRLNVKSAAQVLKERLLPVGRHILALLKGEGEDRRGALEIKICRYVADTYWPSEMFKADHLRIMEIYRNAVFYEEVKGG